MKSKRKTQDTLKRFIQEPAIPLSLIVALLSTGMMIYLLKVPMFDLLHRKMLLSMSAVGSAVILGLLVSYLMLTIKQRPKRLFLSYSFADKDFAKRLAKDLETPNCQILDPAEFVLAGENIKEKVSSLIKDSSAIIFIISKNTVNSKWVNEELSQALQFLDHQYGVSLNYPHYLYNHGCIHSQVAFQSKKVTDEDEI